MHVQKGMHLHGQMHGISVSSPAVHRSILCLDVQGFGGRANLDQVATRGGLFNALFGALAECGVSEKEYDWEDRGDGALVLVKPDVPKERLAGPFPAKLRARLERHNGGAPPGARIKIRVAVHAGEVHYDDHGVTGTAITRTFRLLEAGPLKDGLRDTPGVLALITSTWFYDEVIRQNPGCDAAAYVPVNVEVKETRTDGWMRLPSTVADTTRILRLLALHPETEFSVPAAAALIDAPADETRVLLGDLRLEELAEDRYRVPAVVDGLSGEERDGAVRRVLAWYLSTADAARRLLCPDRIVATLTLPDGSGRPLTFTSADEARRWCDAERLNLIAAARAAADEGHHDIAWRLPLALWTFFFLRSPWTDWIEALRTGLASAEHLGDDRGIAYALGGLGYASQDRWRFADSADLFTASRDVFVRIDDRRGEAWALHGLGYAHHGLRDFEAAIAHFEKALGVFYEVGDRPGQGETLYNLGRAHLRRGRQDSARDCWMKALAIFEDLQTPQTAGVLARLRSLNPRL